MKTINTLRSVWLPLLFLRAASFSVAASTDNGKPVTIRENAATYILENGLIEATISKK